MEIAWGFGDKSLVGLHFILSPKSKKQTQKFDLLLFFHIFAIRISSKPYTILPTSKMTIAQYIDTINKRFQLGNATEHTFRGDLQQLLESLVPTISATNEPKRQACGAPDYILTKNDMPIGFIETKDIGDKDLEGAKKTGNKEQFDRYKASLNNLIFTDYIEFHLYIDGIFNTKIAIAEIQNNQIVALPQHFTTFTNLIKDFCAHIGQTIKNAKQLAEMMAGKARLLAEVIEKALVSDEKNSENSTLKDQLNAFKEILIHDITHKGFADVYAQTIAYGMFAARLHDATLETFSRQKAAELIPKSNPFLRKLFGYIAGPDLDDRIKWIVDGLIDIFLACNVEEILKNYGKSTKTEAPIIHFYETFLSEYDPALRKARGVWYTPAPVVNFMVRAVDDILKTEFDLPEGLADSSKLRIKNYELGKEEEVHKVQILDPATGTGTFLAEVIKHIHTNFENKKGIWSNYVENHLLPRLNGFELLMASYAMAHLQLDLLLTETGFKSTNNQRLRIFLTNSLEEANTSMERGFANWLSIEANEASKIKNETPVMCVIGNPPYSGESQNKSEWIMNLMEDYKKEAGGKEKLKERNPKWINDDYVKFLRFGQHFIDKNGSGILAFINPHGFLDNPTFRGMRWNLLKTYDKIYTIDLHGNSKKKETAPDGSADENVFDIMQGVSINIFVKTGKKKANELGKVFHYDLFGKRQVKFDFLNKHSLKTVPYNELPNISPNYFFVPKDFEEQKSYDEGFKINELFEVNSVGIVTGNDNLYIAEDKSTLVKQIEKAYKSVNEALIRPISYRPFDKRFLYNNVDMIERGRFNVMQHFLKGENLGLVLEKIMMNKRLPYRDVFITNCIFDAHKVGSAGYVFPLYLYPETEKPKKELSAEKKQELECQVEEAKSKLEGFEIGFSAVKKLFQAVLNPDKSLQKLYQEQEKENMKLQKDLQKLQNLLNPPQENNGSIFAEEPRKPNLNPEIVKKIAENLGLKFVHEKETTKGTFAPIDLLDYIYAVLHSPNYREKYKEFLKIDFPRVPYPKDAATFGKLVELGAEIRQIHLLESPLVENYQTKYVGNGDNIVLKPHFQNGKVFINDTQYFENVPQIAWDFYIGGYQPAQKWLKDRKDRKLDIEDIAHYQKIILALSQTDRLMTEIDAIDFE